LFLVWLLSFCPVGVVVTTIADDSSLWLALAMKTIAMSAIHHSRPPKYIDSKSTPGVDDADCPLYASSRFSGSGVAAWGYLSEIGARERRRGTRISALFARRRALRRSPKPQPRDSTVRARLTVDIVVAQGGAAQA
jgi:hypothetical protein